MSTVIMHISDLHFGREDKSTKNYIENRKMLIESFFDSFRQIPDDWKPDILVVTGDVAYTGIQSEYDKAKVFFERFLNLEDQKITKNDIIFCPGNHDVCMPTDRRKEVRPKKDDHNLKDIDDLTRDNIISSKYKFDAFVKFLHDFGINSMSNSCNDTEVKYLYGFRKCKNINFIVLNSEWDFQGKEDKNSTGCLRIGADLVDDAFDILYGYDSDETDTIIALFHRPIGDLHISEHNYYSLDTSINIEARLNMHTDIILNGHKHLSDVNTKLIRATTYNCGTIHDPDSGEQSFWLFRIQERGNGESLKYKWFSPSYKKRHGEWKIDLDSDYNYKSIFIENTVDREKSSELEILKTIIKKIDRINVTDNEISQVIKAIDAAKIDDATKIIIKEIVEDIIKQSKKTGKDNTIIDKSQISSKYVRKELSLKLVDLQDDIIDSSKGKTKIDTDEGNKE